MASATRYTTFMREIYITLMRFLIMRAQETETREEIAQLVLLLNSEDAPPRDQDIRDLLAELYSFLLFGAIPDRRNSIGVIADWSQALRRVRQLETIS